MSESLQTTCPMDCPDACALEVTVDEGRILSIGGRRDHPDTDGFICSKVSRFGQRVDHPDRLLHPMRRVGPKGEGRFERISWEEALRLVAEGFTRVRDEWGGEAILPFSYGGSNGKITDGLLDDLLFSSLGASRLAKTICAAPVTAVASGMYGKMPGVAFEDYPKARFILVWGANPKASNIHLVPYLRAAKAAGAYVAVVDPRNNFSARDLDLHLPVLPGGDLPLALAMIGEWERRGVLDRHFLAHHADGLEPLLAAAGEWTIERAADASGVEPAAIRELAEKYAELSPAVLRCGWGLERNRNGGQAVAAILAMPALLGKFGQRGGGYTLSNNRFTTTDSGRALGGVDWATRELNMTQLGRLLTEPLDPPVKALFVYNANPAATVPEQGRVLDGLSREDLFTVVFEQVMTDTCVYADVLLPCTTFLEHWDVHGGYGSYFFGATRPVIPPRGEARSNIEVFGALGRALGYDDPAFEWDQERALAEVTAVTEVGGHMPELELLRQGLGVQPEYPGGGPVQLDSVGPLTADGRIHLTPEVLGPRPFHFHPLPNGYPLALISPSSNRLISSTLGEFNLERLEVAIHPEDAAARNLTTGDEVRAYNDLGEVRCIARVTSAVRPGVVSMPKGAWRKSSLNGATSTALCPDHVNEVADGACFNDARVEIERLRS